MVPTALPSQYKPFGLAPLASDLSPLTQSSYQAKSDPHSFLAIQLTHQPPPPPSLGLRAPGLKPDSDLSLPSILEDSWSTSWLRCCLQVTASLGLACRQAADFHRIPKVPLPLQASDRDICLLPPCSLGAQQGQSGLLSDWQHPASPHPLSPLASPIIWLGSINRHMCITCHITGTLLVTEDRKGTRGKEKDNKIEIQQSLFF